MPSKQSISATVFHFNSPSFQSGELILYNIRNIHTSQSQSPLTFLRQGKMQNKNKNGNCAFCGWMGLPKSPICKYMDLVHGFLNCHWKIPFPVTMSPWSLGPLQRQWHHLRFLHSWGSVETFVSITPLCPPPQAAHHLSSTKVEKRKERWWVEIHFVSDTKALTVTDKLCLKSCPPLLK